MQARSWNYDVEKCSLTISTLKTLYRQRSKFVILCIILNQIKLLIIKQLFANVVAFYRRLHYSQQDSLLQCSYGFDSINGLRATGKLIVRYSIIHHKKE